MYIASLLLLLLLFQPRTPLLQSKLPPTFQTVSNNEGLYSFFSPKKNKGNRAKWKINKSCPTFVPTPNYM